MNILLSKLIQRRNNIMLMEGGNVSGVTSFVDSNFVVPTVQEALRRLKFKSLKYEIVGNTTKKYSGDVDLAINWKDILKYIRGTKETFWSDIDSYLKTKDVINYQIMKGLGQFSVVVPMVDNNRNPQIAIMDRQGTLNSKKKRAFVQIDFMVGNVDWMKRAFSVSDTSKYKAVYKNIFLADILGNLIFNTKNPDLKRKLQINWREGLQLVDFTTTASGKRKKLKVKTVSGDLDKFYKFLFGSKVQTNTLDSFENIYKAFKSNKFKFPKQRSKIISAYINTLKRLKLDIPHELKK